MKILYGVPGEGMGHATRSKVIIEHLIREKHQVLVLSSSRAYTFLKQSFGDCVHEIKGLHFSYKDAQISKLGTVLLNLKQAPESILHNVSRYLQLQHDFHPDLIISDFESFTFAYAKFHRLPIISIDNMQVLNRCKPTVKIPLQVKDDFLVAQAIVKAKVPFAQHYFITSFFDAVISKKSTSLVKPIIRDAIIDAKPTQGNHILMYQTSTTFKKVKEVLKQLPNERFVIYGMNIDEVDGHMQFKKFSETTFVNDLSSAYAVIANGGFSFISEAVYLHKPIYSFPIKGQFEQWYNAANVERLGYGRHFETLEADHLKAFLYDVPSFKQNLSAYAQQGNIDLLNELDAILVSLRQ